MGMFGKFEIAWGITTTSSRQGITLLVDGCDAAWIPPEHIFVPVEEPDTASLPPVGSLVRVCVVDEGSDPLVVSRRHGEAIVGNVIRVGKYHYQVEAAGRVLGHIHYTELIRVCPKLALLADNPVLAGLKMEPESYRDDLSKAQFALADTGRRKKLEMAYAALRPPQQTKGQIVAAFGGIAFACCLDPMFELADLQLKINLDQVKERFAASWEALRLQPAAGDYVVASSARIVSRKEYQDRVTVEVNVLAREGEQPRTLQTVWNDGTLQDDSLFSPSVPRLSDGPGEKTLADCRRLYESTCGSMRKRLDAALIVDDDANVLKHLSWLLEQIGVASMTAQSAAEAREKLSGMQGLLLVMVDVQLRDDPDDTSGFELALEMASQRPNSLLVLITAHALGENLELARRGNIAALLQKPAIPYPWIQTICSCLQEAGDFQGKLFSDEALAPVTGILDGADKTSRLQPKPVSLDRGPAPLPPVKAIQRELSEAREVLQLSEVCLFRIEPISEAVEIANAAVLDAKTKHDYEPLLSFSPVREVVLDRHTLGIYSESHAQHSPSAISRNKHLLSVVKYLSCYGCEIQASDGYAYALFAFADDSGRFDNPQWMDRVFLPRFKLAASRIVAALDREHYQHLMRQLHILSSEGSYAKGLGHTLMQSLSVLNIDMLRLSDCLQEAEREVTAARLTEVRATVRTIEKQLASLSGISKIFVRPLAATAEASALQLETVIGDILQGVSRLAAQTGVDLRLRRQLGGVGVVACAEMPLRLILLNLVMNAIQMTGLFRPGRGLVECWVAPEQIGPNQRGLAVSVSDNGPGIHTFLWSRIFQPMYSIRENGLGMGLFLAEEAAHSLGATVVLDRSSLYVGSTFKVVLPLAECTKKDNP
jgi:signal transduction histidine kinase/ActR/RegA family two-component response regulator